MLSFLFCVSLYQQIKNCPTFYTFVYLPNMVAAKCLCFYIFIHKSNLSTHSNVWQFHQHISVMYLLLIMFLLHSTITESTPSYLPQDLKACFCSIFKSKFILFHLVWVPLRKLVLESWPWVQWGLDLAHQPPFKFSSGVASHSKHILSNFISLYKKVYLQRFIYS